MSDDAFDEFSRNVCARYGVKYTPPTVRPRPVAVTLENAAQFQPAPKKRGRKPKVVLGGNVVAFRRPQANLAPEGAQEIGAALRKCLTRVDAILAKVSAVKSESASVHAAVKPPRKQKPKAAPLPPAEDDADARLRSFFERINALPIGAMSDKGKDPKGGA